MTSTPETRSYWQIEQGKKCGCRGADEYCPCQNTDSTTPARAEALDEGAAGEASAYRVRMISNDPAEWVLMHPEKALDFLSRKGWESQPLYAHPAVEAILAAPASPLPGGGWQDVSTFTESGQGSPVIVAVPTKEGGWIVGEAWKSVMEPDDPYRGNDGWWWAGTSPGDAYNDPIRFMNHGDAEWWMPLPAAPTGDA